MSIPATPPDPALENPAVAVAESGAERSLAAFLHDRPTLLQSDKGRWVAYARGERVKIANTQTELYRFCRKERGLCDDEFIVACIVPDDGGPVEYTPR